MLDVASGFRPSPRAAFLRRDLERIASISAFYRKLSRMELAIPEAIVRRTAERARQLIVAGGGLMPEPIPGYAARILDGNVLTGTEHRIAPLRTTWSAGLPGMSLAVYEPASGLILDLILEEDAHCQERALLDRVEVDPANSGSWTATSACARWCSGSRAAEAFFLVRWHRSTLPFRADRPAAAAGPCATGRVFEQPIEVDDGDGRRPPPAADRAEAGRADAGRRDRDRAGHEPPGRGDGRRVLRGLRRPVADRGPLPGD